MVEEGWNGSSDGSMFCTLCVHGKALWDVSDRPRRREQQVDAATVQGDI